MSKSKTFLLILTLFACITNANANDKYYYAKLVTNVSSNSTGKGLVYASDSNTPPSDSDYDTTNNKNQSVTGDSSQPGKTFYAFAKPNTGYLFSGWTETDQSTDYVSTDNPYKLNIKCSAQGDLDNANTKTLYAVFEELPTTTITYSVPTNGSYTAAYPNDTIKMNPQSTQQTKTYNNAITLTATPNTGYSFMHFAKEVNGVKSTLSVYNPCTFALSEDAVVYPEFLPDTCPVFSVDGTAYTDLNAANTAAQSSASKTIVLTQNGTLAKGNYNISSGVTLVIPYEETGTIAITQPVNSKSVLTNQAFALYAFRTLKLIDGVNITVDGAISITAELLSGGAGTNPTGFPCRYSGVLDMSEGGHIELNSNAVLYAWGFIKGQNYLSGNNTVNVGTITAHSGATVKECYGIGDWYGGSYTVAAGNNSKSYRIYPFQNYFVQNIEVPLRMEYGSSEKLYSNVYASSSQNALSDLPFIGNTDDVLFYIKDENSAVIKWYDPTTDHLMVTMEGETKLNVLKMTVSITSFNSKDFDLPLPSNLYVKVKGNMTLDSPAKLEAGAVLEITEGSQFILNSSFYTYDHDDWKTFVARKYFTTIPTILTQFRSRGDGNTNTLADAQIICDGTINIQSGGLYTTTAGANIMGNNSGKIIWTSTATRDTATTYGYTRTGEVDGGTLDATLKEQYIDIAKCPPAWMHNDNDSYTRPDSTVYTNIYGRWFGGNDTIKNADNTYNFTYINGTTNTTTSAVCWNDVAEGKHWNNVTKLTDTYQDTWIGTEEDNGITAYYYYNTETSAWLKLTKIENTTFCAGSDNKFYIYDNSDNTWKSTSSIDDDCLYTIDGVRKALVGDTLIAITQNTSPEDGAWHDTNNDTLYYISLSSDLCIWSKATKVKNVEKAYVIDNQTYIRYDNGQGEEWLSVTQESTYYYTTDDQNLRTYFEYNSTDGKWQQAVPRVKVTDQKGATTQYVLFSDAVAASTAAINPTITLLTDLDITLTSDITFTTSVGGTSCVLDLNGHTLNLTRAISGTSVGATNRFFNITSYLADTIKDSSESQTGAILCKATGNGPATGVQITTGSLTIESGKFYVENSSQQKSNNSASVYGVYASAGTTFNMLGGTLETASEYNSCAVYGVGYYTAYATNTPSQINIKGGTVNANAYTNAFGIRSTGYINVSGGTVNATTKPMFSFTTGSNNAYGIYADAVANGSSVGDAYHSHLTMKAGTVNATSANQYAYGIFMYGNAALCTNCSGNGYAQVSSAEAVIDGGTINVISTAANAYGFYVRGGRNTKSYSDKDDVKTVINNVALDVKATTNAYGIYTYAGIYTKSAGIMYGIVEVNGGNIAATTTTGANAYGVYLHAATLMQNDSTYKQLSDKDKKTWYTPTIKATETQTKPYQVGYFGTGAKATINGGTFTATTKTENAYGVYCAGSYLAGPEVSDAIQVSGRGQLTITKGTFNVNATTNKAYGIYNDGITKIEGGTFTVNAAKQNAYGIYAKRDTVNITKGTFTATANTNNAYGIWASSWIDTNTGIHTHATVTVNDGDFTVKTTTQNCAYGLYTEATTAELTQEKYNARTDANKNYYFTESTPAKVANYYRYRIGTYAEGGDITVNKGTFEVEAQGTTAIGAYAGGNSLTRTAETGRVLNAKGNITINGGTFNIKTNTGTIAEGIRSYGNATVNGGSFTVTSSTTDAYGVRVFDGDSTVVTSGTFHSIAGTSNAYGAFVSGECNKAFGFKQEGTLKVKGGTFNVETQSGSNAYGAYSTGTAWSGNASSVTGIPTVSLVAVGNLSIADAQFDVKASSNTNVYGIFVDATKTIGDASASPSATVSGGFYNINNATTTSSAVNNLATTDNFALYGGHFSTNTNLSNYTPSPYHVISCDEEQYKDTYPYEVSDSYLLTWDAADGVLSGTYTSGKTKYGTAIQTPIATREGYEFQGWDNEPASTMPAEDVTYTAQWLEAYGPVLDIVRWTADSLTINATAFPLSGWSYTINDQSYGRNDANTSPKCNPDRTVTIPYSGNPDGQWVIKVTNSSNTLYSHHAYTIPHIYSGNATLSGTKSTSTVFVNAGNLTIAEPTTLHAIYVSDSAQLTVNANLVVDSLFLRTTAWTAAVLQNNATVTATNAYYTRIVADNSQYFQFAIPLSSDVNRVTLSNAADCPYGTTWLLKSYNETSRANNGDADSEDESNWDMLPADPGTIEGTRGYELYSLSKYYREFYFPVTLPSTPQTEVTLDYTQGTADKEHWGWNALCSPLLGIYKQTFSDPSDAIKVSKLQPWGRYQQYLPDSICPAVPFYYQAPSAKTLDFSGDEMILKAPLHEWQVRVSTQWLRLTLSDQAGQMLDETNIFIHPDKFTIGYELGYDVTKLSLQGGKALLYSELPCGKLAFAAVPDSLAKTLIPLTVYADNQEYFTFHLSNNAYHDRLTCVLLCDLETGAVTDLLQSDYTTVISAGTVRNRFYITCLFTDGQDIVTDLDNILHNGSQQEVRKILYNDHIYIIRNGLIYDITGRQCQLQ